MSAGRGAAVGLVLALLCATGSLAAQEPTGATVSPQIRAEARDLFERAGAASAEGRFAVARDLLRRSLELVPNVGAAFNLAVALRGTGEIRAAVRTFDALIVGAYGPLSPAQTREAEGLRDATRRDLAQLEVHATGAPEIELRIDGEVVGTAHDGAPVELDLDPGEHVLLASAPHSTPYEERIRASAGARAVVHAEVAAAASGTLVVEAAGTDAIAEIQGVARGRGTISRELPAGEYRVSVRRGDSSETRTVRLEGGETVRVALTGTSEVPLVESPWLWTGLGAVLAGAVVAIVVPLTVVEEAAPITDPTYGVVATLTIATP